MLHLIKNRQSIEKAIKYSQQGDHFLLMEEAVYFILETDTRAKNSMSQFYLLQSDLNARGLINVSNLSHKEIQVIDYAGFVELTTQHTQSITWS